ncbi:MAG: dehydrogenase [Desulfobacteraceae bacterium 4572_123]|nr:MAG: dehydrogenase [Desulfobacteraceae bacterium 4572_123]
MKRIINISLGPENEDYQLETEFSGKKFFIQRFGTDNDLRHAEDLLLKWNKKADVLCVSGIQYPSTFGNQGVTDSTTRDLLKLCDRVQTLVTTGETLYRVSQEWSLRHIQFQLGNNYFTNANVFFFSGMTSSTIATVMSEYTDNMVFADPILENGIPKLLCSINELKHYAQKARSLLKMIPVGKLIARKKQIHSLNIDIIKKAVKKADILIIPHHGFYEYLEDFSGEDLAGKTVITTTAYDNRVDLLTEMEVGVIIDTTPKLIDTVVEGVVSEALMIAAMEIPKSDQMKDDLLEIISEQRLDPTIIYPFEPGKRVNRFAYLIHPLSREYLKKIKAVEIISEISPKSMGIVEKALAYTPPFVYSRVTGIKSPTGVEAQGWLITIGETPEQMQAHPPEFTTQKILQASRKAKKLGAQVMGIGMLPKQMHGASLDVGKHAALPTTTGNSYTASTALWATAEAVRLMGLSKLRNKKTILAKAMVIGATGTVGAICSRLLATVFEEVVLVSRNMAKLLTLEDEIQTEKPDVKIRVSTRADRYIETIDVVVMASLGAKNSIDIMRVKPGCVITDITRPMVFTPKEVAKRQDVLVITGGEILLPGETVEMKDIGLPKKIAYAGLAETIILALEGRFEEFTTGSETQWEKVKEIYKLGLKHGMKLASISGVNGVLSEDEIARVKENALKQMKKDPAAQ